MSWTWGCVVHRALRPLDGASVVVSDETQIQTLIEQWVDVVHRATLRGRCWPITPPTS